MSAKSIAKKAFKSNAITEEEYKQLLCVINFYYESLKPKSKWIPIKEEMNWGSLHMIRDCYQCENCGNKSNRITRFCDECGYSMEVQDEQKFRDQSEK